MYGSIIVSSNDTAVPGGGTYLRLLKANLDLDFSAIQPKYISFNFYDTTGNQNLRFNNSAVYIGTLTSVSGKGTPNGTATFATGDKTRLNKAEFFTHDPNRYIGSIWVGGDDFGIDNVCWDTVWHGSTASTLAVSSAVVALSLLLSAVAMVVY